MSLDADFLLTAPQQDDQAETLLLQLLRGAGPKGLAAMAELQSRPGWRAAQLRPRLGVTRAGLLDYAAGIGLEADLLAAPGEAGVLPRVTD